MPFASSSQKRLMEAAAHTKGGYGGVPQSVGEKFVEHAEDGLGGSARRYDADGRLHLAAGNPISKATVSPYMGHEIPNCAALGWNPNKVYYLLRDPDELAKAAPTFNNLPILSEHIPVSADAPRQDLIIGSTGTDSRFDSPYLTNSLVFWVADAIERIEHDDPELQEKELSSAYYYRVDPQRGEYEGLRYDGIMRDIVGNHVALVKEGRAGPDVVVGDSAAKLEITGMAKSKLGLLLTGALVAHISPKLAQDAQIDFGKLTEGLTRKNFDKTKFGSALRSTLKGKLAQDADLDDVAELLEKVDDMAEDEDEGDDKEKDDDPAMDEGDDEPKKPEDGAKKPAQDGMIALDAAVKTAVARVEAIYRAREEVAPVVGKLAQDAKIEDEADVFKIALDHMSVDLTGLPRSAYGATFRAVQRATAAAAPKATARIAQDAAATADYQKRYGASRLVAS